MTQQIDAELRATVEKVLALEQRRGYRDDAVIGGLEEFVRRNLPEAAHPIVAGYRSAPHFARVRTVEQLLSYLRGGPPPTPSPEALLRPVADAVGVGTKRAKTLERLGIKTIEDLLLYLPRRLEDRREFKRIGELRAGETVCVQGKVARVTLIRVNPRMRVVKAAIGDGTGFLYAVWFNQPWVANQLRQGEEVALYGKVERSYGELQMRSPVWEPAGEQMETGRLVPIYPATEGASDRLIRGIIARNLELYVDALPNIIPEEIRNHEHLMRKPDAVRMIHFPLDEETFARARRSLAYEELFLLQLGLLAQAPPDAGIPHADGGTIAASFLAHLPFRLTRPQAAALREIVFDLRSPRRMMRLLQGDVGAGKTIVALAAALYAIEAGYQVAFMAPTEILAEQHAARIEELFSDLPVRVGLLTSSTKDKSELKSSLSAGEIDLLVGTHALIQEDVAFANLGFVVIDEQHRFGVVQRAAIEEKGENVDLLVMSATPIPRTIALTLYGEFEVSLIDSLPYGTPRIRTVWVAGARRDEVYSQVGDLLAEGRKGFVVLPLVEESEKLDLNAAVQTADELRARFPGHGIGLVHGRMESEEKHRVMADFHSGAVQLLVATTVIEVGIDVPDADFMVIEHAERFGLSQLHQLRGRIGRKGQEAICFAIGDAKTEEATRRLTAFSQHLDGFRIAEEDLLIRGPGDLLGTKQHGFLSSLRAVDLIRDIDLMQRARTAARELHRSGIPPGLLREVERRFCEVLRWLQV